MAFTEDQLAAAFMAKFAGTTLKEVDENTTHQSSTGPATKLDPKQFLITSTPQQQVLHQPQVQPQVIQPPQPLQPVPVNDPNQLTFNFENIPQNECESIKLLRQIRDSLTELITIVKKQNNAENNS